MTIIEPGSPRWAELVREGIIRDGNRNWFLGDAALEIAPMSADGVRNGSAALLERYADEVGIDAGSLRIYRQTAAAWPAENRFSAASWKVHQLLMGRQDLIKPGMTVTQAHAALGQKTTGRTGPQSSVEDRAAAARELLTDPDVAQQVVTDKQARASVNRATDEHYRRQAADRAQRTEQKANADPVGQRIDAAMALNDLSRACERFSRDANEALRHVGELPDSERHWLTGGVDRAESTVRAARRYLELGKSEFDAELEHLLQSGA